MSGGQKNKAKGSDTECQSEWRAAAKTASEGMHQCPSLTSFRTATPVSTFGHPLRISARQMTRDPAADLRKCASTASVCTLAPEPEFGHQLHRCAKHMEQIKDGSVDSASHKGKGKADDLLGHREPEQQQDKGHQK